MQDLLCLVVIEGWGINHGAFPSANITPEAIDNPKRPRRTKSLPRAPISLPAGPPLTYPQAQITLIMIMRRPRTEAAMGKQMPAQNTQRMVEGAISTQLQWALWALLKSNHSLQLSFCEQRPEPISGAPPFSMSLPVALLCSSPKCCSKNSLVKTFLAPPGTRKPMRRISRPMRAPTMMTYPKVLGRESATVPVAAR